MIYKLLKLNIKNYLYIFFLANLLILLEFSTNNALSKNYVIKNIIVERNYNLNFDKQEVFDKGFINSFENFF